MTVTSDELTRDDAAIEPVVSSSPTTTTATTSPSTTSTETNNPQENDTSNPFHTPNNNTTSTPSTNKLTPTATSTVDYCSDDQEEDEEAVFTAPQIQTRQQTSGLSSSLSRTRSLFQNSFKTAVDKTKETTQKLSSRTKAAYEHHDIAGKAQRTPAYLRQSAKSVKGRFKQFDEKTGFTSACVNPKATFMAANGLVQGIGRKKSSTTPPVVVTKDGLDGGGGAKEKKLEMEEAEDVVSL